MPGLIRLATGAGVAATGLLVAAPVLAQGTADATSAPIAERLTLFGVYADASIVVKLVLWGLTVAVIPAVAVWLVQFARLLQGRSEGAAAGIAYLSGQAAAAPLFGLFGLSYAVLNGCIGIANVRPTPSLTVLAPGLAEAFLSLGLGLLAAAIATVGHRHLKARLQAIGEAEPTTARSARSSSHPACAIA